ncbi:MAG: TolC family protein [Desulfobacterales bacterium]|nr:TolC family protein [Desulfobacterales bacterium]
MKGRRELNASVSFLSNIPLQGLVFLVFIFLCMGSHSSAFGKTKSEEQPAALSDPPFFEQLLYDPVEKIPMDYIDASRVIRLAEARAPEVIRALLTVERGRLRSEKTDDRRFPSLHLTPRINAPVFGDHYQDMLSTNLSIYWNILSLIYKDYRFHLAKAGLKHAVYNLDMDRQKARINALKAYFNYLKSRDAALHAGKQKTLALQAYEDHLYLWKHHLIAAQDLTRAKTEFRLESKNFEIREREKQAKYKVLSQMLGLEARADIHDFKVRGKIPGLPPFHDLTTRMLENSPLLKGVDDQIATLKMHKNAILWKRWTNAGIRLTNSFNIENTDIEYAYEGINLSVYWSIPLFQKGEQDRVVRNYNIDLANALLDRKNNIQKLTGTIEQLLLSYESVMKKKQEAESVLASLMDEKEILTRELVKGQVSRLQFLETELKVDELKTRLKSIEYDLAFNRASIDIICGDDPRTWF